MNADAFDLDFEPLPPPGPHDWLANHPERGQTFEQFVSARANRPDLVRKRIDFLPLEAFSDDAPSLEKLKRFAEGFFMMDVEVLPAGEVGTITRTKNPYGGQTQLLTSDILALLETRLPKDAFCLLAITMHDLYPDPRWNFVFGQASLRERVGVYSFARYASEDSTLMLRRSCKVLAHETGLR